MEFNYHEISQNQKCNLALTSDFELNLTANPFILVSRYISHLESNDQAKNEAGEIEDVVQVLVIDSSDSVGGGIRPNYRPGLAT